jgi:hypothetical protein
MNQLNAHGNFLSLPDRRSSAGQTFLRVFSITMEVMLRARQRFVKELSPKYSQAHTGRASKGETQRREAR